MLKNRLLTNIRKREWLKKQSILKSHRDRIWQENDELGIKTYLNWHLDFFTRFYKPLSPSARILDIGCGYMIKNFQQAGELDRLMFLINSDYAGIDPVNDWFVSISDCRIKFHIGFGEQLPFKDNSFDAAMLLGVLDHVIDPCRVISEAHRVIKRGGRLWFANSYIEGNRWKILTSKLYHKLGFDKHHRFMWTPVNLKFLISKIGFFIERTDRCMCDVSFYIEGRKQ